MVVLVGVEAGFESFLRLERSNAGQAVQRTAENGEDEGLQQSFADLDSSGARNVDVSEESETGLIVRSLEREIALMILQQKKTNRMPKMRVIKAMIGRMVQGLIERSMTAIPVSVAMIPKASNAVRGIKSSTMPTSRENRFNTLPIGVLSKKLMDVRVIERKIRPWRRTAVGRKFGKHNLNR